MATPIGQLNAKNQQWIAKKPIKSNQEPTTTNAYIEGGPFYFGLHGAHRKVATVNPSRVPPGQKPPTALDRAVAVADLPVILSDGHIKGDQYQQPGGEAPTGFVKISDEAAEVIQSWQAWARQTILEKQGEWGLSQKSEAVLDSQFLDQLSCKDGSWAVSVKWFRDSVKIFIQDRDRPWVMKRGGTAFDLTKGCRIEAVGRFGGIRLKAKEWSIQKIIIEKFYIFTCGGNVCPDLVEEEDDMEFEDEIGGGDQMDTDPYAAAGGTDPYSAAPAPDPEADVDGTTMVGM